MRKAFKYILILLILLFGGHIKAQKEKIDSVSALLKASSQDTARINLLHELVFLYLRQDPDTARVLCREALELSEKLDWQKGIGQSHYCFALLHDGKGEYPAALDEYNQALNAWSTIEESALSAEEKMALRTSKARALTNIANDHTMQGNFPKALKFSFDALKLSAEIKNKYLQANNYANIANVFSNQKEFSKALDYYFRAEKMYEELDMKNGVAYCYIGIGNAYNDQYEHEKALEYYFRSLKINEEMNNKHYIAANLGNIGSSYDRQGKEDLALEYFLRALKIDKELGNNVGMAYRMSSIGSLYTKDKKYNEAEKFLLEGLSLAESIGVLSIQKDDHRTLSEMYAGRGDHKNALQHFKKFSLIKDSIFNEEKNRELTRHELNYEFEKKEAELKAEQDKKDAVAAADKKRQKLFFWMVCAIAAAVALVAVIVFRSLRITRKQKSIIEEQKLLVENKQKEILDSIHYAKRIQQSLLPQLNYIHKNLKRLNKK
jgi:tetratricopeptide (TPR) repeat protein